MSFVPVCDCYSPPTAPATPTLQALVNELASVENWHLLGVNLGLQGHQLHEIERNYPRDNRRKTETLELWLRNAKCATWEAVAQALCLMDEHVVADAIRRKYGCLSTTTGKYSSRKFPTHNKTQITDFSGLFVSLLVAWESPDNLMFVTSTSSLCGPYCNACGSKC